MDDKMYQIILESTQFSDVVSTSTSPQSYHCPRCAVIFPEGEVVDEIVSCPICSTQVENEDLYYESSLLPIIESRDIESDNKDLSSKVEELEDLLSDYVRLVNMGLYSKAKSLSESHQVKIRLQESTHSDETGEFTEEDFSVAQEVVDSDGELKELEVSTQDPEDQELDELNALEDGFEEVISKEFEYYGITVIDCITTVLEDLDQVIVDVTLRAEEDSEGVFSDEVFSKVASAIGHPIDSEVVANDGLIATVVLTVSLSTKLEESRTKFRKDITESIGGLASKGTHPVRESKRSLRSKYRSGSLRELRGVSKESKSPTPYSVISDSRLRKSSSDSCSLRESLMAKPRGYLYPVHVAEYVTSDRSATVAVFRPEYAGYSNGEVVSTYWTVRVLTNSKVHERSCSSESMAMKVAEDVASELEKGLPIQDAGIYLARI